MRTRAAIAAAVGAGALVLVVVALAAAVSGEPVGTFSRDLRVLSAEAGAPLKFYAGSLSILNGWVWSAGAALSFAAAGLRPRRRRWLTAFGLLMLMLTADDSFLIHESVGPSRGVPEPVFYVLYAVVGAALLAGAARRLRDGSAAAFLVGGVLLAASVVMDLVPIEHHLLEDGTKLLGALVWVTVPLLELERLRSPGGGGVGVTARPDRGRTVESSATPD